MEAGNKEPFRGIGVALYSDVARIARVNDGLCGRQVN
jgi:hypothetical protein